MARLWTESFDSQSAAGWNTTNGTVAYDTTTPRRGAASLRCNPTAAASSISKTLFGGVDNATAHVYLRAYVRVTTAPSARTAILAWSDDPSAASGFYCIKMNTDRTLIASGSAGTTGTASAALTVGTWYRVEMDYDDSANTLKAYLDGTLWATVTGADLGGGAFARVGVLQAATANISFDDVALNDSTGTADNGLPGAQPLSQTAALTPASATDGGQAAGRAKRKALGLASQTIAAQALARRKTKALGTATETTTAQVLAPVSGVGFTALADDFNDNITDPVKWPDSYEPGGFTEVGGRARVACTTDYNAYASAEAYRLRESRIHCRVYPPAAGGATAEAWAQVLVQTTTPGTDATFEISAVTGSLVMASRVAYYDPAQIAITYDPVAHAWLRIRETGGALYWDTSPDGTTWTNRRTAPSPAWVGDTNLQVQLIAHRDGGTPDYAEFDAFNSTTRQQLALGAAAETVTAQALVRAKTASLARPAESVSALPLPRAKSRRLPPVAAAEGAQLLTRAKRTALPAAAAEGDAAQALSRTKRTPLGTAVEAGSARPLPRRKGRSLPPAGETSKAQQLLASTGLVAAGDALTARTMGRIKTTVSGTAEMVETARPLGRAKVAGLGVAAETAEGRPLTSGRRGELVPAEETCTARPLGRARTRPLGLATGTHAARPLPGGKAHAVPFSPEAGSARPVTGAKRLTLTAAEESGQAQALAIPGRITTADETSTARSLHPSKTQLLAATLGVDAARALPAGKRRTLGVATESSASLDPLRHKRRALTPGAAVDEALPAGVATRLLLGAAREVSQARIGPFVLLTPAVEWPTAAVLSGMRQRPADQLDATTSGPRLSGGHSAPDLDPATAGPFLAASSTGPHLTATVTGG
ncbi:hypothetical protein ACWGDS_26055 [Streptomyces sp. NPDC055059]